MQISLDGANRSREATQKLRMFSKQWEPGNTYRVFYRTYKDVNTERRQMLAGAVWGHKVNDMKALSLKTTFIPSLCEYDADGNPIGHPDILYRFARLAPLFVKGQYRRREDELSAKDYPSEALRRDALRKLDEEYDTKNKLQAVKPVIGRATMLITVEAIIIPYKDDKPNFDIPIIACQPVSTALAKRLTMILNDSKNAPIDDDEFLETEWVFPMDTNKAQSGQKVVPTGVDSKYSMKEQFPDEYAKVKLRFGDVSSDSDMVIKRATSGVSEAAIRQALTTYSFMHSDDLQYCVHDDELLDNVMNSADVIMELNIARAIKEPVFTERLNKEVAAIQHMEVPVPQETDTVPEESVNGDDAASVAPEQVVPEAPTIGGLLAQQAAMTPGEDSLDSVLDDVDLGAFQTT